jgi:hypothetical protein
MKSQAKQSREIQKTPPSVLSLFHWKCGLENSHCDLETQNTLSSSRTTTIDTLWLCSLSVSVSGVDSSLSLSRTHKHYQPFQVDFDVLFELHLLNGQLGGALPLAEDFLLQDKVLVFEQFIGLLALRVLCLNAFQAFPQFTTHVCVGVYWYVGVR